MYNNAFIKKIKEKSQNYLKPKNSHVFDHLQLFEDAGFFMGILEPTLDTHILTFSTHKF